MGFIKITLQDKFDLNYHLDGQPSDGGVTYRLPETARSYVSLDAAGVLTPLAIGAFQVEVLDAATEQVVDTLFFEIQSKAEAEFEARIEAGEIKLVQGFTKLPDANLPPASGVVAGWGEVWGEVWGG